MTRRFAGRLRVPRNIKTKSCAAGHIQRNRIVGGSLHVLLALEDTMRIAANHQHRALLAIIAGGAAVVGMAVLTAGSLASTTRARADTTPTFGTFVRSAEYLEPATLAIVPSPVMDTHPEFYFGTGDGSCGYYAEQPSN
jgi:hypothetical protein